MLREPVRFPEWWGEVYLDVTVLDRGDANGVGSRIAIHSRGWLPYRLQWEARIVRADFPRSWEVEATGDLTGRGVWTLFADGGHTIASYDWRVRADRPLFRVLAAGFAPLMASNHLWAMRKGETGLRRELAKRE
ncbi:MAG: hypothetical protein ACKVPY_15565 [Paracoccaceae bacterium]